MDQITIRRVALYVFAGLQVLKATQAYQSYPLEAPEFIIFVWSFLDFVFLLFLRRFSKPRLTLCGVAILFFGLFIVNAGMVRRIT